MTGMNRFILNPATMIAAIQYYLDNENIKVRVTAVESTNEGFVIRLAEPNKTVLKLANGDMIHPDPRTRELKQQ
jgi:hypothetical protein